MQRGSVRDFFWWMSVVLCVLVVTVAHSAFVKTHRIYLKRATSTDFFFLMKERRLKKRGKGTVVIEKIAYS